MRNVVSGCVVLLSMAMGCGVGESDPLRLQSDGSSNNFDAEGGTYSTGFSCNDAGSAATFKMTNTGSLPTLDLVFKNSVSFNKRQLSNPSKQQRCEEMLAYMLSDAKFDFTFTSPSTEDESRAKSGSKIAVKPEWVNFKYMDGTLNEHSSQINLRCESNFLSSCSPDEDGDCSDYFVLAPREICTFRALHELFEFSDHKKGIIDIMGQIDFTNSDKPILTISNLAVSDII